MSGQTDVSAQTSTGRKSRTLYTNCPSHRGTSETEGVPTHRRLAVPVGRKKKDKYKKKQVVEQI